MRLIDADAFKKYIRSALEEMRYLFKDNGEWAEEVTDSFCKDIDEQPTIELPQWIPCSERLPENNQICLVCGQYGGIRVARVYIPAATEPWNGDPNTNWWTVVGTGKSFNAVAWMPLPEPFNPDDFSQHMNQPED